MRKQVAVSYNTYTPGIHNEKDRVLYLHTLWYMYIQCTFLKQEKQTQLPISRGKVSYFDGYANISCQFHRYRHYRLYDCSIIQACMQTFGLDYSSIHLYTPYGRQVVQLDSLGKFMTQRTPWTQSFIELDPRHTPSLSKTPGHNHSLSKTTRHNHSLSKTTRHNHSLFACKCATQVFFKILIFMSFVAKWAITWL